MKKLTTILLCVTLLLSFAACRKQNSTADFEFDKNPLADKTLSDFSAKDLNGKEITNEIFKDKNITLINLWATWCGPCVEEMPDFQKLYKNYKDKGLNVIGLLAEEDVSNDIITEVKGVIEKAEVKYPIVIVDKTLFDEVISQFDYIPVTLFVDNEGKVLETFIPGSTDYESLENFVKDYVKE